jgi:hypothetical protein
MLLPGCGLRIAKLKIQMLEQQGDEWSIGAAAPELFQYRTKGSERT